MYEVGGGYQVPFPYHPYPLQRHAISNTLAGLRSGAVVVLESPTGTGKTQVLLTSALSHLYETTNNTTTTTNNNNNNGVRGEGEKYIREISSVEMKLKRRSQKRRREERRNKRKKQIINRSGEQNDAFLLEQDCNEEMLERQRQMGMMNLSSSSSSCSRSSTSSLLIDSEDEGSEEEIILQELRKPKIYFSSRTHTQLQQLTEELRKTVFAKHPVKLRQHIIIGDGGKENEKNSNEGESHNLRYVHIAGRQQLCLNASIRAAAGGNNERLNELCLEAIKYEYSKEGRAARKQQQKQSKGGEIFLSDIEDGFNSSNNSKGCSYCQRERLKILNDYIKIESRGLSEMREIGKRVNACPFLATREQIRGADVVLIPYSYLVSSEMRNALLSGTATNEFETSTSDNIEKEEVDNLINSTEYEKNKSYKETSTLVHHKRNILKNSPPLPPDFSGDLIVVDEAHNLVDFCRSATAASITKPDLSLVRMLLNGYHTRYEGRLLTRNKQRIREMIFFIDKLLNYLNNLTNSEIDKKKTSLEVGVYGFSSFVFDAGIDTVNVFRFLTFLNETRLLPKLHGLVSFLAQCEEEKKQEQTKEFHQIHTSQLINDQGKTGLNNNNNNNFSQSNEFNMLSFIQNHKSVTSALHRFENFLRWYSLSDEYTRVLLKFLTSEKGKESESILTLQLLQLEPGMHTLFPLLQQTQAAVLAGGTMKPLALTCDLLLKRPNSLINEVSKKNNNNNSLTNEMKEEEKNNNLSDKKIRFIEEGHIVPPSSVAVFTLGVGPSGFRIEIQHSTRHQWNRHFEEVAVTLLNFSRIIPAGMIVFFTSYEIEEFFVTLLHHTGMYDKINEVKRIFREPGRNNNNNNNNNNNTENMASKTSVDVMLTEYANCIRNNNSSGALLFAVMGGKLSEGINFNDDLGRAVVVVGLPYANPNDVELQLYLNHIVNTRLMATPLPSSTVINNNNNNNNSDDVIIPSSSPAQRGLLTDLCMRVVNQSTGRCIRHAGDYAVVILFDARYGERSDIRRRIASWMQPSVRVTQNFGECFRGIREFFAARKL